MTIETIKQIALTKYGKTLTDDEAKEYVAKANKLSDDELDNVTGGCFDDPTPKKDCPNCGTQMHSILTTEGSFYKCPDCGISAR